jgi:hypothetical protein
LKKSTKIHRKRGTTLSRKRHPALSKINELSPARPIEL